MSRKEDLRAFLDSMIDKNPEQAQVHFHNYLQSKTKAIINPDMDSDFGIDQIDAEIDTDAGKETE